MPFRDRHAELAALNNRKSFLSFVPLQIYTYTHAHTRRQTKANDACKDRRQPTKNRKGCSESVEGTAAEDFRGNKHPLERNRKEGITTKQKNRANIKWRVVYVVK